MNEDVPPNAPQGNRTSLYTGHILNLVKLDNTWEVIEHAPAVCILALDQKRVLGVVQPRPAIGESTWELPAGIIDPGETPDQAAKRELSEETNLTGTLTLISQVYTSPGFCDEKVYLYHATNLQPKPGTPDPSEAITIMWHNVHDVWQQIAQGQLQSSAPTLIGLAYAHNLLNLSL